MPTKNKRQSMREKIASRANQQTEATKGLVDDRKILDDSRKAIVLSLKQESTDELVKEQLRKKIREQMVKDRLMEEVGYVPYEIYLKRRNDILATYADIENLRDELKSTGKMNLTKANALINQIKKITADISSEQREDLKAQVLNLAARIDASSLSSSDKTARKTRIKAALNALDPKIISNSSSGGDATGGEGEDKEPEEEVAGPGSAAVVADPPAGASAVSPAVSFFDQPPPAATPSTPASSASSLQSPSTPSFAASAPHTANAFDELLGQGMSKRDRDNILKGFGLIVSSLKNKGTPPFLGTGKACKPKAKPAAKAKAAGKSNPWMIHLNAWRKAHPDVSFGKAMKEAAKSYKPPANNEKRATSAPKKQASSRKQKAKGDCCNKRGPNPWLAHVKAFRQSHPSLSYKDVLSQAKPSYKGGSKPASKKQKESASVRNALVQYLMKHKK